MYIVCLDLEGVLIPEVFINLANKTGISVLQRTTRDEPNYDILMRSRLKILADNGLGLPQIQAVVDTMEPLPGAVEFITWLRERFQVVILSDTYYEFVQPLMKKLGFPTLLCHRLETDANGIITNYIIRQPDPKRASVIALKSLRYKIIAAGDSYNDINMLSAADTGFLFDAPDNVIDDYPQFPSVRGYEELKEKILKAVNNI